MTAPPAGTQQQEPMYLISDEELTQYAVLWAEAHSADMDSIGKVHARAKETVAKHYATVTPAELAEKMKTQNGEIL